MGYERDRAADGRFESGTDSRGFGSKASGERGSEFGLRCEEVQSDGQRLFQLDNGTPLN